MISRVRPVRRRPARARRQKACARSIERDAAATATAPGAYGEVLDHLGRDPARSDDAPANRFGISHATKHGRRSPASSIRCGSALLLELVGHRRQRDRDQDQPPVLPAGRKAEQDDRRPGDGGGHQPARWSAWCCGRRDCRLHAGCDLGAAACAATAATVRWPRGRRRVRRAWAPGGRRTRSKLRCRFRPERAAHPIVELLGASIRPSPQVFLQVLGGAVTLGIADSARGIRLGHHNPSISPLERSDSGRKDAGSNVWCA